MLSLLKTSHNFFTKPCPFQERLSRYPLCIHLKQTFFWISFFIPFLPLFPKKQGQRNIGCSRKEVECCLSSSSCPHCNSTLSVFPLSPTQGPNPCSGGQDSKEASGYGHSTKPQRHSYPQNKKVARPTVTAKD